MAGQPDYPPKRFRFTKKDLQRLPCPPKPGPGEPRRQFTWYDTHEDGHGLGIICLGSGTKSFFLRRRIEGRVERFALGEFPSTTIDQARQQALDLRGKIAQKDNPAEEKRSRARTVRFGDLFTEYLEAKKARGRSSWQEDQAQHDRYLKDWDDRLVRSIRPKDVEARYQKIGQRRCTRKLKDGTTVPAGGPYAANRVLALLHAMFERARGWDYLLTKNPAKIDPGDRYEEQERERFIEPEEMRDFFVALLAEANTTARDFFLVDLLTAARRDDCLAMRWADISFISLTWKVPDPKGKPYTVPLVRAVWELLLARLCHAVGRGLPDRLAEIQAVTDDQVRRDGLEALAAEVQKLRVLTGSPFVFPGRGQTGHYAEPKSAWKRILEAAGLENLRVHDLRRTMGSWQAAGGSSLGIIGKSLGHKPGSQATKVYARLNLDPVRDSMEKAADAILRHGGLIGGESDQSG